MYLPGSGPFIICVTLDRLGRASFYRSDGKEASFQASGAAEPSSRVQSVSWLPAMDSLVARTVVGDDIAFELASFGDGDQLDGRLIVYLDQNQWSLLARAQHDPGRVHSAADVAAAKKLLSWVRDRRVVLPLSSGHQMETTEWGNAQWRYELGLTTLQLSRGWQMQHPLEVRHTEIAEALRSRYNAAAPPLRQPVITLDTNASMNAEHVEASHDLPASYGHMLAQITAASVLIDVMLDSERIEPGKTERWVYVQQGFSNWIDECTALKSGQKRKIVDEFLFRDIGPDFTRAASVTGITPDAFTEWLSKYMSRDINAMPSLGIYRAMLQDRHINVGTVWRSNDLTDMTYLACAAGYAHTVIAERHMTAVARQALRRLGRPQNIYPSIREGVAAVEGLLASHEAPEKP